MKTIYQVVALELVAGDISYPGVNEVHVEAPTFSHRDAHEQFDSWKAKLKRQLDGVIDIEEICNEPDKYSVSYSFGCANFLLSVELKIYEI